MSEKAKVRVESIPGQEAATLAIRLRVHVYVSSVEDSSGAMEISAAVPGATLLAAIREVGLRPIFDPLEVDKKSPYEARNDIVISFDGGQTVTEVRNVQNGVSVLIEDAPSRGMMISVAMELGVALEAISVQGGGTFVRVKSLKFQIETGEPIPIADPKAATITQEQLEAALRTHGFTAVLPN